MAIFGGYFGGYFGDYSKRTHHGILKLGLFHCGICLKVTPVEKSLGTFFPADLQLRTRVIMCVKSASRFSFLSFVEAKKRLLTSLCSNGSMVNRVAASMGNRYRFTNRVLRTMFSLCQI